MASQTYRAVPSAYASLVGIACLPGLIAVLACFRQGRLIPDLLIWSWLLPVLLAAWLSRFRLRFDPEEVTYTSLFGGTRRFRAADVRSVGAARATSRSVMPLRLEVHVGGGEVVTINAKPFSPEAVRRLLRLSPPG